MNNARLVGMLTLLYPGEADSLRIMQAAGIDPARIRWESKPNTRWYAVVDEAEKAGRIDALIAAAQEEYPDYQPLTALAAGQAEPLRILLLAGRGVLAWVDEEADKWEQTPNLTVFALRANVTPVRVLNRVLADEFDVLVILGHGDKDGVDLGKGQRIERAQLAQLVRGRIPNLFINTCESEESAELIRDETGANVICTIGPVDDKVAYFTGAILASHLGGGATFRDAYELSKPGANKSYRYLPALPQGGSAYPFRRSPAAHVPPSAG